ncbi:MAG TPA: acyl-CoA dehydrogenase family protein [Actinomycetota bacterium]|nr:acyl-CoA dehydrogenase family protein [Actinomycetota bacterium]
MDFRLTEDQMSLKKGARDFLEKEASSDKVKAAFESEDGAIPGLYKKMADLGWAALAVPEDQGGLGAGLVEQAALLEELGYFNVPGPFFSTVCLGIPVLLGCGEEEVLARAIGGETTVTVADDRSFVIDPQLSDYFIVCDQDDLLLAKKEDVKLTLHKPTDGTRRTGAVEVDRSNATRIGDIQALGPVIWKAGALLSAESVGGMQRVLDTTLEYSKVRTQFGRLIGSFQVVKHRLADMLLKTESARSAAYYAAWANEVNAPDAVLSASVAKSYVSDAYQWVAGEGVQLHGGIGFTWEHEAHLYFKRAYMNAVLLGDAAFHRDRALTLTLTSPDRAKP